MSAFLKCPIRAGINHRTSKRVSLPASQTMGVQQLSSNVEQSEMTSSTPQTIPKKPKLVLSPTQIISGSSKSNPKSVRGAFSTLQWLHIRLGHASRDAILSMVRNGSVMGAGISIEELEKDKSWIHCDACEHGRMHSFPVPASISMKIYDIFQFITSDYVPFLKSSIRGYVGSYIFGDKASGKLWSYLVKSKTEWLSMFKLLQAEYGPNINDNSHKTKVFSTDYDSVVHASDFTAYLLDKGIRLFNSAPHKHAQNLIERYIQTLKNMIRTNMYYNRAPGSYWCYALQYSIDTYNMLAAKGLHATRNEVFSLEKTDISKCVPFYARGWSYINESERKYLAANPNFNRNDKALDVRMLGYTDPHRLDDSTKALCYLKNSYLVESALYSEHIIRHDCHFQILPDSANYLFHSNPDQRTLSGDSIKDEQLERALQEEYDTYLDTVIDTDLNFQPRLVSIDEQIISPNLESFQDYWIEDPKDSPDFESLSNSAVFTTSTSTLPTGIPSISTFTSTDFLKKAPKKKSKTKTKSSKSKIGSISSSILSPISPMEAFLSTLKEKNSSNSSSFSGLQIESSGSDIQSHIVTHTSTEDGHESLSILMGDALSKFERPHPVKSIPGEHLIQPISIIDALQGNRPLQWIFAALDEIHNLDIRETWEIIPQGEDKDLNPIKSKFAFRLNIKPDDFLKFRTRLVACGYSQVPGRDYDLTFAPTAKYKTLCIILHLCAIFGWKIAGIDVSNAYIEAKIDKLIHMKLPKELFSWPDGSPVIVRLKKSLYGLKQAGELWNSLLNEKLIALGFTRCMHDKCIYYQRNQETGTVTFIVVYVDDVLFVGNSPTVIESAINFLISEFTKLTNMGEVTRYLGIELKRDFINHTIELSQKPYIVKYLSDFVDPNASVKQIPLPSTVDYSTKGDLPPILDKVGSLRFLADRTRPDILTAVGSIGSAAANPTVDHVRGADHIGRYLAATKDKGVVLGGLDTKVNLFGYSDASHLPHGDSKPRIGYCFYLNKESGVIYARSHFASNVSHSSCESEVFALDECIREALYLRGFLSEIGFPQRHATVIYTDSVSAKSLIDLFNVGSRSAHIIMRLNFLHEQVLQRNIELKYVNTDSLVADILTKLLSVPKHELFTKFLLKGHNGLTPSHDTKGPLNFNV